jgi:hypothetical protein
MTFLCVNILEESWGHTHHTLSMDLGYFFWLPQKKVLSDWWHIAQVWGHKKEGMGEYSV